jgi:hypothetical protein
LFGFGFKREPLLLSAYDVDLGDWPEDGDTVVELTPERRRIA